MSHAERAAGRGVAAVRVATRGVDDLRACRVAIVRLAGGEVATDLGLQPERRTVVVVQCQAQPALTAGSAVPRGGIEEPHTRVEGREDGRDGRLFCHLVGLQ